MAAPTLLVGLGGTGSKIVCRVANMVSPELKNRIGFAVFDTDINELRDIQEANPFVTTIQTSTKLSVGEYLNIDTHARDNWFPVNAILNSKTLTEGAGQVRAISRLALDTAIRAGNMDKLHAAIENLYKVEADNADQALRVVIVSSLAGGTGSGLILPVALYIKNFLITRFQQSANIVRGFFILPEVFFEVIRGQSERNNLMCNAYATIRELDAFLMKGDGTLPEKYDNTVKLEFPRIGSMEYDEYRVRPYDFCFLFDAQNTAGRKLNNFNQYLDHAANCIYSQSIGPMNKRSNSSEDNTIRELCAQRGRNRYAGAGCSMLVYPFEDVKEYIALRWAQQTISEQWLKFDRLYIEKIKENQKLRAQGVPVRDLDAGTDYIETVDALDAQKDVFAISIVDQCKAYDETGLNRTRNNAEKYMNSLLAYIEKNCLGDCEAKSNVQQSISDITGGEDSWSAFQTADSYFRNYMSFAEKFIASKAPTLAFTIFKAQSDNVTKEKRDYQLETYLRNDEGDFIHPNAVRYFLYQCQRLFSKKIGILQNQSQEESEQLTNYKNIYDDSETDEFETVDMITNRKIPLRNRLMKKLTEDQEALKSELSGYVSIVDTHQQTKLKLSVLTEGLNYIKQLSESFSAFYLTFESKVMVMSRRMSEISKRYTNCAGKTTRYVCASPKCLNTLAESIPYTGSAIRIDGSLADEIYSRVRVYAMLDENERPENGRYFNDLFDNTIIGYYKKKMLESYGAQVDMDIISAMEREIEIENGECDPIKIEQMTKHIIENTRKMSTPFIERPMGEQIEPISACTYHPDIDTHDDSPRAALIAKELNNFGGTPDSDIGKNMIMFYQSIYGLRANRLSKFAPAREGINVEGVYHKAYYELVRKIVPVNGNVPIITPHIDKNWHLVVNMPDLDEADQKCQETRIYKAFVLGLIYEIIKQKPISEFRYLYKLELNNCTPEEFVVSNKTPCDLFYEVLDALTINPLVVDRILKEVERLMLKELNAKTSFASSEFLKRLRRFKVVEYAKKNVELFRLNEVSIFDFSALLGISAPDCEFSMETGIDLMRTLLYLIRDYMKSMTDSNALDDTFGRFIVEEYTRFTQTRRTFLPYRHLIWFIGELKRVAVDYLKSMDLDEYAQNIEDVEAEFEQGAEILNIRRQSENLRDADLGDDEAEEINTIAGSETSSTRGMPSHPMISLSEHRAQVDALNSQISSLKEQFASYSREMETRFASLSRDMSQVREAPAARESKNDSEA